MHGQMVTKYHHPLKHSAQRAFQVRLEGLNSVTEGGNDIANQIDKGIGKNMYALQLLHGDSSASRVSW